MAKITDTGKDLMAADATAPAEQLFSGADPTEVEAIAQAAAPATQPGDEAPPDDEGRRVRLVITTKDFLPGGDTDWPRQHIAPAPRGTRAILGNLAGQVLRTERRTTPYKDKVLESVWLHGNFEAMLRGTGEIISAPAAILPRAFGTMIENALADCEPGEKMDLRIDCDIGLEATGRSIPYEWIVIYYHEGKAQKAMREIRSRRDARIARQEAGRPLLIAPSATPAKK